MRRSVWIGCSVLVAQLLLTSPTAAQEVVYSQDQGYREGLWGSFGGGVGFNLIENSEGERLTGFTALARGGWAINAHWLIGADAIGWFYSGSDATLRRGYIGAAVLWYPSDTQGFYMKGGMGGSFAYVSTGSVSDGTTWGFGSTLGFGYDFRLSDAIHLTLGADWLFQSLTIDSNKNNQVGMLTAALTIY